MLWPVGDQRRTSEAPMGAACRRQILPAPAHGTAPLVPVEVCGGEGPEGRVGLVLGRVMGLLLRAASTHRWGDRNLKGDLARGLEVKGWIPKGLWVQRRGLWCSDIKRE